MRNSKTLKIISYILIPILILIIGFDIFYIVCKENTYYSQNKENYFESDVFLNNFMTNLSSICRDLIFNNDDFRSITTEDNYKICYTKEPSKISYLIIYKNLAITNIELTTETNTIEKIKNHITNLEGKKVTIIDGVTEADSELIRTKSLKYYNSFINTYYSIVEKGTADNIATSEPDIYEENVDGALTVIASKEYYTTKIEDFQIYSSYLEVLPENNKDLFFKNIFNLLNPYEKIIFVSLPISSVSLIIILVYLIIAIGHSKDTDGIDLNDLDKIPIEIILFISAIIVICIFALLVAFIQSDTFISSENYDFAIYPFITVYLVSYVVCEVNFITIIKRLKSKTFIKTSYTIRITLAILKRIKKFIKNTFKLIKKIYSEITSSLDTNIKLFLGIIIYCVTAFLLILALNVVGIFIDALIIAFIYYKVVERENCNRKIKTHLKDMYEGDNTKKLDSADFTKEFQDEVKYINDISSGFENAIQEGIKSERLKTELITNVSHDIKTPLTSIINYVDLIKKENSENEKIKEYIEILDIKSQKLKKLTEDLVEASKASSGNVNLNLEKINISELIKQSLGEFEDKFNSKNLEIISEIPNDEILINADSRYMFRIIENLFTNISKYALESSRVYIDVIKNNNKVLIIIKNISKERLNISADELIQRFVRGDKSRNTEGSGLGISISKSLTELQNGTFDLQVDGDLFRVDLEFNII